MLGFNNDAAQAERVRAQVMAHTAADEIIQGDYWQNGKGCFIGCLVHGSDARAAAKLIGGDLMLIKIIENIFERLPSDVARGFPARIVNAIAVGADLSLVPWQFLEWAVVGALAKADEVARAACQPAVDVVRAKARGEEVTAATARAAAYAANAACAAADAAAYDAAVAARAAAVPVARAAAYDAAVAARAAADAAAYDAAVSAYAAAVYAAAVSAYAAAAYAAADDAAAAYGAADAEQANKIIELMEAA